MEQVTLQAQQTAHALQLKTLIALPAAILLEYADIGYLALILVFYLFANSLDLFLGVASAVRERRFKAGLVGKWVIKTASYLSTILIVAILQMNIYMVMKIALPILEYYVLILTLNECASIIDNIIKLGFPVPPLLVFLVGKFRRDALKRLLKAAGAEGDKDTGIDALAGDAAGDAPGKAAGEATTGQGGGETERRHEDAETRHEDAEKRHGDAQNVTREPGRGHDDT
ncbi:MAG: phage holin family protein [Deltaproteobacteria bacterium]|nr:phage holin family protein [Deltaproteobacteria bacterium]